MSMRTILNKMFGGAEKAYDSFGQPIQDKSMEERLLEKHLEIERRRKIKEALKYYEKKHYKEMTSMRMPYHDKFRKKGR